MSNQTRIDTSKSEATNKYHVPALEKGLDILEALAHSPTSQSLADLARTLDRSSSELFRMLNCLENRDYIRKQDSGAYSLTLKLYELAHTHSPVEELLQAAAIPMEKLAHTLQQSCHLSVLRHGKLVVLSQALSPNPVRLSVEVGGHFSPIHTVSGRLLLAHLPPSHLQNFTEHDSDYQQLNGQERQALLERLQHIQETGVSEAEDESHYGIKDMAVLIGNPDVGLTAALAVASLVMMREPITREQLLEAMQACAQKITHTLGLTG